MSIKNIFKRISDFLLARPLAGGLEISDTSLRFINAKGNELNTFNVRLAPGVMDHGRIENLQEFVTALRDLRNQILGSKSKRSTPINAVVSLSSVNIYTQVFSLPLMEGDNLEKAIQLNIKMASPTGESESYSGWETVRSQEDNNAHLEVVTAFLQRGLADELTAALRSSGFIAIALESRALSFARLIKNRAAGVDPKSSLIAISADASGIDVMIVRAGHLHFDYYNSWKSLQGDAKEISVDFFKTLIVRSVNQVMNFYNSHWKDPVAEVIVASTGLKEEILTAIQENFDVKVSEFSPLVSPPITSEWFVALGSALRSLMPRREDVGITLLGVSARSEFQREQVNSFLGFWRVLVPATLAVLLITFIAGYSFLNRFQKDLQVQASSAARLPASSELSDLRAKAERFNNTSKMIAFINDSQRPKGKTLSSLLEIFRRRGISISRLEINDPAAPITFNGIAPSQEDITALKNELEITPGLTAVQLPITSVKPEGNFYSFSMTFLSSL